MNVTSLGFLIFLGFSLVLFYCFPEKQKPFVLIFLSFVFVASYDVRGILFLLGISLLIWAVGRKLQETQTEAGNQTAGKSEKRRILTASLILVCGLLTALKYVGPMVLSGLRLEGPVSWFVPIGLSYYTLEAVSYLMDVYWGRIPAEKHYSRVLLYLSYFPKILQGPISRFGDLSREFYEKDHPFRIHNIKYGLQLVLWGFFKLLVVGDKVHAYVADLFHSGQQAYGLAAFAGLVFFGFELYANFSGGIDVIRGVSQCLGIELTDNFKQPFFSRSLGEFWRRWHISLGAWMKDYVFFPLSMSRPFSKLKKNLKKHVDKKMATRIPIALADVAVFLLVGIWHGLGTNYALWGLYNGLILAFSEIMTVRYRKTKDVLKIRDDSKIWTGFCILRTFLIVTLGWCTDCASTAGGSFRILFNMLQFGRTNFGLIHASMFGFAKAAFGIGVLAAVDLIHEKGYSIRDTLDKQHFLVQLLFWTAVIQMIACFGRTTNMGGLMYAGF